MKSSIHYFTAFIFSIASALATGGITSGGESTQALFWNLVPTRVEFDALFSEYYGENCHYQREQRLWQRPTNSIAPMTAGWSGRFDCYENPTLSLQPFNFAGLWLDIPDYSYPDSRRVWHRVSVTPQSGSGFGWQFIHSGEGWDGQHGPTHRGLSRLLSSIAMPLLRQFDPDRPETLIEYVRFLNWFSGFPMRQAALEGEPSLAEVSVVDRLFSRSSNPSSSDRFYRWMNLGEVPTSILNVHIRRQFEPIVQRIRHILQSPVGATCNADVLAINTEIHALTIGSQTRRAEWRALVELSRQGVPAHDRSGALVPQEMLTNPWIQEEHLYNELVQLWGQASFHCSGLSAQPGPELLHTVPEAN